MTQLKRIDERWPDFTVGENYTDTANRLAHSIEIMADKELGQGAVQFMRMVAFGISNASQESACIVESEGDEGKFYQLIRVAGREY